MAVNYSQAVPPGIFAGGSYFPTPVQTGYEKQAGVTPEFFSMLDENGKLKAPFAQDPTKSAAFTKIQDFAMGTDASPWATLQKQALAEKTKDALDKSNTSSLGATDQAMQNLMMTGGGVGGGAAQNLALQGARNATMAGQNIRNNDVQQSLAIDMADADRRTQMLNQVANAEVGANAANTQTGINDLTNNNIFQANRYKEQMAAWGAAQTAAAQQAAAGGKK